MVFLKLCWSHSVLLHRNRIHRRSAAMMQYASSPMSGTVVRTAFLWALTFVVKFTEAKLDGDLRIIGGTPVTSNDAYPSYAFSAGSTLCGGTLIQPDIVLTAAHCKGAFLDGVFIGGTDIFGSGSEYFEVLAELPNTAYEPLSDVNDIMLVQLRTPSSAPLQQINFDAGFPLVGSDATVIGYGVTSFPGGTSSTTLMEVTMPVVSHAECDSYYNTIVEDAEICTLTTTGGKDSCQGDSGGPLLVNNIQVGIVSFGDGCAKANVPSVFARTSGFEAFVNQGICDLSSSPPASCDVPVAAPVSSPVSAPVGNPIAPVTPTVSAPVSSPVDSPVGSPIVSPAVSPVSAPVTVTAPVDSPAGVPVVSPALSPVNAPIAVTAPATTPAGGPVASPVLSPVSAPIAVTAPATTPAGGPVASPASSPVSAPVTVTAPATVPAGSPVASPASSPVNVPVAVPVASPMTSPVAVPVAPPTFPVTVPVSLPVVAPNAAPILMPVKIPVAPPVKAPITTPGKTPLAAPSPTTLNLLPISAPALALVLPTVSFPVGSPDGKASRKSGKMMMMMMKKKDDSHEPILSPVGGPTYNSGKGGKASSPTYNSTKAQHEMRTPGKGMRMSHGTSKNGGSMQMSKESREANPPPKKSNNLVSLGGNKTSSKLMEGLADSLVKAFQRAMNVTEGEEHELFGNRTSHNRTEHGADEDKGDKAPRLISFWELLQGWVHNKTSSGTFNRTNGLGNHRNDRNDTATNRTEHNRTDPSNDEEEDVPLVVSFWWKVRGWWMNTTAPGWVNRTNGFGNHHHHDGNFTSMNHSSAEGHNNRTEYNRTNDDGTSFWDKLQSWMMNTTGTSNWTHVAGNHHPYRNHSSTNHSAWENHKNRTDHDDEPEKDDLEDHDHDWNNTWTNQHKDEGHKNRTAHKGTDFDDDEEEEHDLLGNEDHHWDDAMTNHSYPENHKNKTSHNGTYFDNDEGDEHDFSGNYDHDWADENHNNRTDYNRTEYDDEKEEHELMGNQDHDWNEHKNRTAYNRTDNEDDEQEGDRMD